VGQDVPLAALKAILAAATMTDTTRSWAKLSQPSAMARMARAPGPNVGGRR